MADVIDYRIHGDDMQLVEIELDPGEGVRAEAGAMLYTTDGIRMQTGTEGGIFRGLKRMVTGESFFITSFVYDGSGKGRVAFAAPYPGKVIPLDLGKLGGKFLCQKDAFLCAAYGTQVGIAFQRRLGTGFFGGEGFILQQLRGDGMVFVHACGTIIERQLQGETLRVDTGCLVAFEPTIDYNIERAGSLKSMFFAGEGLFLATLSGHGRVWMQSLPFSRLADRILAHAPSRGGSDKGEGSVLGGIGRLLDGN